MGRALQPQHAATSIVITSGIQLSGTIARSGRAGLITAIAMFASLIPCTTLRQQRALAFVGTRGR
jgi:hypothetical protein